MNGFLLAVLAIGVAMALAWPWLSRRRSKRGEVGVAKREPVATAKPASSPADSLDSARSALEEIEFDHETGKLSDEDYRQLSARYQAVLAAPPVHPAGIAKELTRSAEKSSDAISETASAPIDPTPTDLPHEADLETLAERLIAEARKTRYVCPVCGPRPEPDARFCSSCGRFIRPCPGCGREVSELGSRFCAVCGADLRA